MANQLNLNQTQLDQISTLTDGGTQNFYLAYEYISGIIANNSAVDDATKVWFQRAAEINSNDPNSAANIFIRAVPTYSWQYSGNSGDLSKATNDIGLAVIGDILRNSHGVPTLDFLVGSDISSALSLNNITIGGWGGSFYYWDTTVKIDNKIQTVGQFITSNPIEYNKFVASNAAALVKTVGSEWDGPINQVEYMDVLSFGIGANLPLYVKLDILDRAISSSSNGNYAGNPNIVTGFTLNGLGETNYGTTDVWFYDTGTWYTIGDFGSRINASPSLTSTLNNIRNDRLSHQGIGNYLGNQTFDNLGTGVFSTFAYGETAPTTHTDFFNISNSIGTGAIWSNGLTADFASGIVATGGGWGLSLPGSILNSDGLFHVAPSSFLSNGWRPGAANDNYKLTKCVA